MATRIRSSEARAVIDETNALIQGLEGALGQSSYFDGLVREAVESLRSERVAAYLSDVPAKEIADIVPSVSESELLRGGVRSASDLIGRPAISGLSPNASEDLSGFADECTKRLLQGIRVNLDDRGESTDVQKVVPPIRSLISYRLIEGEARRLLSENEAHCRELIEAIRPITNPIGRLFVSRDEKNAAISAFEELSRLLRGEFGNKSKRTIGHFEKVRNPSIALAAEAYRENPAAYRSVIGSVVPGCLGHDDWGIFSSNAVEAKNQIDALLDNLESASDVLEACNGPIKEAVDKCLARELLVSLGEIPVEELNRDKSGIRVSALAKAGYKTVADVYVASEYALRAVRGVGDSSVFEIKRKARQYAQTAQQGLKLRLSADNRSTESTRLITVLHKRIKIAALCEACSNLAREKESRAAEAEGGLRPALGGLTWIFASPSQIDQAESSFSEVRDLIDGDFGDKSRELLREIVELRGASPSPDDAWASFAENPIPFTTVIEQICPDVLGADGLYGLPEDLAREVQEECFFPDGLLCTLRRYQEWGVKYILHQGKVLLGDEMGLGKTIQAIAVMVSLRNVGHTHFVVVCPASVLENWCREIRKFSKLSVTKVHGYTAKQAFDGWRASGGVAVTTYETTAKLAIDDGFTYGLAVVDEAHYIKNPGAARTANVLRLCDFAKRVLFMTGTALENKVSEMLQLIGDLRPDIAQKAAGMAVLSGAQQFRDVIAPVYYRRKRSDVLSELPDLIENEDWCQLGPAEEIAYEEALMSRNFMSIRRVSWNVENLEDSSKACRLREIVSEAAEDGRKTLVFTFFRDVAWDVANMFGDSCVGMINGSVPAAKRQDLIEQFESAPAGSVLVAQIQSGGTGLNIQSASVVVICEPQFKPSIENQAISRAYRMGQARNVLVHRLLCENTVDERLMKLLQEKQRLFDAFADKSSAAAIEPSVDSDSFGKIVEDEIERIKKQRESAPVGVQGE